MLLTNVTSVFKKWENQKEQDYFLIMFDNEQMPTKRNMQNKSIIRTETFAQ